MSVIGEDIIDRLARLETKVDVLLHRDDDTESRLRSIERRQWYHTGAVAAAAVFLAKVGVPFPLLFK